MGVFCTTDLVHISWSRQRATTISHGGVEKQKARRRSLSRLAMCILRMAISVTASGDVFGARFTTCFTYDFYSNSLLPTVHDYTTATSREKKISKKRKTCTGALSSPSIRTEDGASPAFVRFSPCSLAVLVLQ